MGLAGFVGAIGYDVIFIVLGAIVTLCGIIGLFTIKDSTVKSETNENYWNDLIYSFHPSVVKENKRLYLALSANCLSSTAFQVFSLTSSSISAT